MTWSRSDNTPAPVMAIFCAAVNVTDSAASTAMSDCKVSAPNLPALNASTPNSACPVNFAGSRRNDAPVWAETTLCPKPA